MTAHHISDTNSKVVWAIKFARNVMLVRVDALDDGWSHKGKLCGIRLTFGVNGVSLVIRKRMYIFFWSKP